MKNKTRILHIDDNVHDRQLVYDAIMIEHYDFELIEAESRIQFEKHLEENDFDLVLSDFDILGFDGLQVLQIVKEKNPDTPVIIVTGTGSEEIAVSAMKLGASDYVIKSVRHIQNLVPTIRKVMEHKKVQEEYNRALAELRESEDRFRLLFENSIDAVLLTEPNGSILKANASACVMFGKSESELKQLGRAGIIDFSDPRFANALDERFRNRKYEGELTGLHYDGTPFPIEISTVLFEDSEGKTKSSMFIKDLTERKKAKDALLESENRYKTLAEISPVGIFRTDASGSTTYVNPRWSQISGLSSHEAIGNGWLAAVHPEDRQKLSTTWTQATNTNSPSVTEYRFLHIDGSIVWVMGHAVPEINSENQIIGYVGTITDITEQILAAEEINKLNESLEQRVVERTGQLHAANVELEAFSYSVSHDLQAPLRHINGFVDMLREDYRELLPDKAKHYLEVIVNSTNNMATLIDDLLQFSRTGRQEMQESELDMNAVVQEVLNSVENDIGNRKIDWDIAELPKTKADHSLLRMVWFNLLSNAVKFTKYKEPALIQIGFLEDENEYVFFVRDNGAGFDMLYANRLFGVFQRLHSKQEFEGTGIGLANVRRIILKHGGRTWAESQLNEGATFYFTLHKTKQ